LGKTAGKDAVAHKATYPAILGIEASEDRAQRLVTEAIEIISSLGIKGEILQEVARLIIARRS
jgi:geranylgeranyl pyrophosphate synthase